MCEKNKEFIAMIASVMIIILILISFTMKENNEKKDNIFFETRKITRKFKVGNDFFVEMEKESFKIKEKVSEKEYQKFKVGNKYLYEISSQNNFKDKMVGEE